MENDEGTLTSKVFSFNLVDRWKTYNEVYKWRRQSKSTCKCVEKVIVDCK